jgi:hypothetical protein
VGSNLSRNSSNTIILPAVNVYLRHYPGTDQAGAIANASFVLKTGGTSAGGKTNGDGLVPTRLPVGQTVTLEVFGSSFDLKIRPAIEDVATIEGAKRRLHMLGYRPGTVNATVDLESDRALLKFQADQAVSDLKGYDNTQVVDTTTRNKLKTAAGD